MITGLRIKVPSAELKQHLTDRSKYHHDRSVTKQKELPGLQEALEKIKATGTATNVSNMSGKSGYQLDTNDAVDQLKSDIQTHRNKALAFRYMADHLFDEDYDLKEEDLVRLEILKRY